MTECSPGIAGRGLQCEIFGTIGPAVAETELRIVDEHDRELPHGQEGEIQVRGGQVFQGYYNDDEADAQAFTSDGFLRTGDLGRLTLTGELIITGRAKEIIVLASGENIDPTNVEATCPCFPSCRMPCWWDRTKGWRAHRPGPGKIARVRPGKIRQGAGRNRRSPTGQTIAGPPACGNEQTFKCQKGFKPYEKLQNIHFLNQGIHSGEELTNSFKKNDTSLRKIQGYH